MTPNPDPSSTGSASRQGRFEQILLPVVLVALVGGGMGLWWIVRQETTRATVGDDDGLSVDTVKKLEEAREKADTLDPGWRLADLITNRPPVPDEINGAMAVLDAQKTLSVPWSQKWLSTELIALASLDEPSHKQLNALKDALAKDAPALREASRLADLSQGRYPVKWNKSDPLITPLPHLDTVIAVHELLFCDVLMRVNKGDLDGALKSARALLNSGRSIGDEPTLHSQLTREQVHFLAAQALERILAHGQPSPAALEETQKLFADEGTQPLLLRAARAARAGREDLLNLLQESKADLDILNEVSDAGGVSLADLVNDYSSSPGSNQRSMIRMVHTWLLNFLTDFVEIVKLPQNQQPTRLQVLLSSIPTCPKAGRVLIPAVGNIVEYYNNTQAFMRCSAVAMALERFRQAKGVWPDDLAALVPEYLSSVPNDPHNGKPLRYRRHPEGVAVYSIGPDNEDNGGEFKTLNTYRTGTDLGFRLWEPAKRAGAKTQK